MIIDVNVAASRMYPRIRSLLPAVSRLTNFGPSPLAEIVGLENPIPKILLMAYPSTKCEVACLAPEVRQRHKS
jgi:hypothetical protein